MIAGYLSEIALLFVGIGMLWKGADWIVHSACRVARRFKLSDVVIGATVVALGTSAPEVTVTLVAAWGGRPEISVGNVIGSNIFNLGIILGGCATIWVIPTTRHLVYRDAPVLLLATLLLLLLLNENVPQLDRGEGLAMIVFLGSYVLYLVTRGGVHFETQDDVPEGTAKGRDYFTLLLGLAAVISGAHLLVDSASDLASLLGLSEWAIGVTIVAAGTSLPELATALVAAHRGRMGLMAGTLVGSDLFNVLGVLGLAGLFAPEPLTIVSTNTTVCLSMMAGMLAVMILLMRTGWRLTRLEGLLLVALALLRWAQDLA
jgi:cation:H+ antiporter